MSGFCPNIFSNFLRLLKESGVSESVLQDVGVVGGVIKVLVEVGQRVDSGSTVLAELIHSEPLSSVNV